MIFVHWMTRLRYEVNMQLKLNIHDEIWEHIIESFYKIPYFRKGINCKKRHRKVIISLTTIPTRIDKVWLATESLLRQQKKPDKVILWLGEDEFKNIKVPEILERQKKRGLEIRYCPDLKSYKKFYYAMTEFPDDYILTVDDDCIYSEKMVEEMVSLSRKYPHTIVCNRSHKIRADKGGLLPYLRWTPFENRRDRKEEPAFENFFTGCGGTLIPAWLLDQEIFRSNIFMKIAPTADDVWLNFNAWKSGMKVAMTKGILGYIIPVHSSSDRGLSLKNRAKKMESWECENDIQIRNVIKFLKIRISDYIDVR